MEPVGIGIIGCGNISAAYLKARQDFPDPRRPWRRRRRPDGRGSARAGVRRRRRARVDALLADPAIEIILNLTIPNAHVEVGLKALAAGKHVHSEKPLGVAVAEARG